jgi:hypothetical protein
LERENDMHSMRFLAVLAGACAVGLVATSARAALILNINNGAIVVTDNGAGDSDPTVGRISNTTTSAAGYSLAISLATSNSPGSATAGLIQLNSLDVHNATGTSPLDIRVSDTNFTSPGGAGGMLLGSSIGGTFTGAAVGDSVQFQSFADPANGQPASAVSSANLTFTKAGTLPSDPFNGQNVTAWTRGAGAYSLADHVIINLSANGQVQISGATNATVPEPAVLSTLALGSLGLVARRRRTH